MLLPEICKLIDFSTFYVYNINRFTAVCYNATSWKNQHRRRYDCVHKRLYIIILRYLLVKLYDSLSKKKYSKRFVTRWYFN